MSKECDGQSDQEANSDLIVLDSLDDEELSDQQKVTGSRDASDRHELTWEELKTQVETLKKENDQLKQQVAELLQKTLTNRSFPVHVIFNDRRLAKYYKAEVEQYMQKLVKKYQKEKGGSSNDTKNDSSKGDIIELKIAYNFCVDSTKGSHRDHSHDSDNWKTPLYDQVYNEALDQSTGDENPQKTPTEQESPKKLTGSCFNCLGDHMVGDCPKELDTARIKKNRMKFNKSLVKSSRYHVEEQRSNTFQAGTISENLRSAMDLRPDQLPPYIYRMRLLGYPPGWMKEAEIESSGLMMYDSEGKAIANNEEMEDGEVDTNAVRVQFDPKKLVDFPGFNVYPPAGVVDESDVYGMPPMQECHLRSFVERMMKPPDPRPYRKKKLASVFEEKAKRAKVQRNEEDMEVEDIPDETILDLQDDDDSCRFIPPLPPEEVTPPPPPDDEPRLQKSSASSRSSSPSLTDLEEAKQKLMKELEQVGTDSDSSSGPRVRHASITVTPGTPALCRHSDVLKLPDREKFSVGIADHLPFENLPNSVGTYDKMRHVIKMIRDKVRDT